MKKSAAVLLCSLVLAAPAFAGEDSTDHWGDAGTGPSIFESPCGLADFQGEDSPMPEKCRPAHSRAQQRRAGQPAAAPTQGSPASRAAPEASPASAAAPEPSPASPAE